MRRRLNKGMLAALIVTALMGVAAGVGSYTFIYAEGGSYLTDDPAACANCHVMQEQYDAWTRSSHHAVAACNDCHTPDGFFAKYATKALNGYHHSLAFTTGDFHEPIQITPRNAEITEAACRRCHADVVEAIDPVTERGERMSCVRCHLSVGHLH